MSRWSFLLSAGWILGCHGSQGGLGPGQDCFRTVQCADGLACVLGVCSTDLGPLAEAGTPAFLDGSPDAAADGAPSDGSVMDAPPLDAPPLDTAVPPPDTAVPDTGAPDTGLPDAGMDAGGDAGASMDAGGAG